MNKIVFFFSILSFCFGIAPNLLAQENVSGCRDSTCSKTSVNLATNHRNIASNNFNSQFAYGTLTEDIWKAIASRYYQSRLRTNFNPRNDLLSLWDVKEIIGFSGIKVRESQEGNRQYWVWIDRHNPQKKIKATFNYYQLVDLKGVKFEAEATDLIRAESSRIDSARK